MSTEDHLKSDFELYANSIYNAYQSNALADFEVCRTFLEKLQTLLSSKSAFQEDLNSQIVFNEKLLDLLKQYFLEKPSDNDVPLFEILKKSESDQISQLTKSYLGIQKRERYHSQGSDSFILKILKSFKRLFFNISKIPTRVKNSFRRLFKKETKTLHYAEHIIYSTAILEKDIFPLIIEKISDFENVKNKSIASIFDQLLISEKERDFAEFEKTIRLLEEKIEKELKSEILNLQSDYLVISAKSGTIEYPKNKLSDKRIIASQLKGKILIKKSNKHWKNTLYALFEDWRLNKDLLLVQQKSLRNKLDFEERLLDRFQKSIKTGLDEMLDYIKSLKTNLEKNKDTIENLKSFVRISKYDISKSFSSKVEILSERLINQGFLGLADKLEYEITSLLDHLPESSCVIKNSVYDRAISLKELEFFSPKQLITYKALPEFQNDFGKVKVNLNIEIEKEYQKVKGFHDSLSFCFASAFEMLQLKEEQDLSEIIEVLESGLSRIEANQNDLLNGIQSKIEKARASINLAVKTLIDDLAHLEANENVSDIRIKIAKGKARKSGKEALIIISEKLKVILHKANALGRLVFRYGKTVNSWVQRRLFLNSGDSEVISSDISNFLSSTLLAVDSLPVVYRKLFEPKPVSERNLFVGRKSELAKINKAYSDWKSGRYSATVLFGERGSGLSSLVNIFVSEYRSPFKLKVFNPNRIYSSASDFQELIKELEIADYESDKNNEEEKTKRIIIIDGIEKLYLRKVNGFDCIKMLLKLILSTNAEIFWVCTCSIHTWRYLNKTISINDYFDFTVELQDFTHQEIADLIMKRNQISGYKVVYDITEANRNSKSFRKLDEKAQQDYLQTQFFKQINRFANSNVSLALIFWIQMTSRIEGNVVFIKNFEQPNFNFLISLNPQKTYILLLAVMQQILNPDDLSDMLNCRRQEAELELRVLKEDGVMIKRKDNYYTLNPILYRHVVDILKVKNLLH